MKKLSKKKLKEKLDNIWAQIIKSKGYCEVCHSSNNLNAHHVVGRINYGLRWDLRNGCCLCPGCHMFSSKTSAHNNPIWFLEHFKFHRPDDYEYLLKTKNKIKTFSIFDYQEILNNLKEEYEKLEAKKT